jgi:hypothetical protein
VRAAPNQDGSKNRDGVRGPQEPTGDRACARPSAEIPTIRVWIAARVIIP